MIFRVLVVAYGVGAMMGFLGLVEWLIDRASRRVWLTHFLTSLLFGSVALLGSLVRRLSHGRK